MEMKKIFLFIFAFTISFSQAQNADKAKAYLDEVYKKVTLYRFSLFVREL